MHVTTSNTQHPATRSRTTTLGHRSLIGALAGAGLLSLSACSSLPFPTTTDATEAPAAAAASATTAPAATTPAAAASTTPTSAPTAAPTAAPASTAASTPPSALAQPTTTAPTLPPAPAGPAAVTASVVPGAQAVPVTPAPDPAPVADLDQTSRDLATNPAVDLSSRLGTVPTGPAITAGEIGVDGNVNPETWPDACQLLSDADLTSLLPATCQVVRKGQRGAYTDGGETAGYVNCVYEVPQPDDAYETSTIEVTLVEVGSPTSIASWWAQDYGAAVTSAASYPGQFADFSNTSLGGASCFEDLTLKCSKGQWPFTVTGTSGADSTGLDVDYPTQSLHDGWTQGVLVNVAATLASRMS